MIHANLRIIDANLNRAREALRVIEDDSRFRRNESSTTAQLKAARHALQAIVETIGHEALLAARFVEGDVGREIKTDGELTRANEVQVVHAAFARLTEALRSISEYAKIAHPAAAKVAESLRYDCYALQQKMLLRDDRLAAFRANGLYAILTESICRSSWRDAVIRLIEGGVACIQLREKSLDDRELLARARWIKTQTAPTNVLLCINDRPDIAALCDADVLHLGRTDVSVADARAIVAGRMLIGTSTHSPTDLKNAEAERPDYVAIGPMYHSTTKPRDTLAGVAGLERVKSTSSRPVAAIGGITLENVSELVRCGADLICVCHDLIAADDVATRTRDYVEAIASARQSPVPEATPGKQSSA